MGSDGRTVVDHEIEDALHQIEVQLAGITVLDQPAHYGTFLREIEAQIVKIRRIQEHRRRGFKAAATYRKRVDQETKAQAERRYYAKRGSDA